jgi:hypothetical protein
MAIMFLLSPWLRLNIRRAAILILITWLFSSLMAFPLLIVNEVCFLGKFEKFFATQNFWKFFHFLKVFFLKKSLKTHPKTYLHQLPLTFHNFQTERVAGGVEICQENWKSLSVIGNSDRLVHYYTSALFALQYCLPLLVLVVTYTCIGIRMWNSKVPGTAADRTQSARYIVQGRHDSVKKVSSWL